MTRREQIVEILNKEEKSAQDLANYFRIEMFEILIDLKHIEYSIKPKKLVMRPAQCKKCAFIFKERSRVKKPSKCPSCKGEWILAARFRIG
jgi:predicted Zn-ribbon and HTH transcriptional regulator